MKFISKPNPYADVYRYVSNIAHDYSNEAVQQIRISIVNGMIRTFKFATDDYDALIYVLINFDDNPYYLEWGSPEIHDVFNLIALFKGVILDEDDWDEISMLFCDYIHGNHDIEKVDFGGEWKVYLNEINTTEATTEVC